jgi:hypothetical protein
VVSGAVTTNKATISSIQTFMQGNLDLGVTSVGITLGTTGTDVSVSGSPITSSGNITINIPTASATNRGALSSADWSTFNGKQGAITLTTTGTSGASTLIGSTLNIPNYTTDLSGYVTLGTAQTITAQKTFTTSGSSDTMIISHGSGSGFALDVIKAGSGEAIRVTKTSGSGNAMTISGGNFEAPTIVKTGGTSSQFLKADGSVDSNSYALNSSLSLYLPLSGGTMTGILNVGSGNLRIAAEGASNITILRNFTGTAQGQSGFNHIGFNNSNNLYFTKNLNNGCIFSFNNSTYRTYTFPDSDATIASTSNLSAYLPLTGGTLSNNLFITGGGLQVSGSASANRQVAELYTSGSVSRIAASYVGSSSYGSLELLTSGLARLTIADTGAATFSSSVTATSLFVNAGTGSNLRVISGGTNVLNVGNYNDASGFREFLLAGSELSFYTGTAGGGSTTERMRITSGGSLLVGTDTAGFDLTRLSCPTTAQNCLGLVSEDDSNNGAFIQFRKSSITAIGSITRVGTTDAVLYNTTSDYRLKEDLQEIEGLQVLSSIKVYNYKWKNHESRMDGVLAHELAEVLPYAVHGEKDEVDEEGNDIMQGVDYSKIVPILIKAIQELKTEIDSLKNQIK